MIGSLAPRFLLPALGAVCLLLAPGAYAAGPQNADQNAKMSQAEQLQKHLRDVQNQLTKIQEDTSKNDPAIKKQEDDFQAYLAKEMKAKGYTPDEDMKKIEDLRAKMQDKSLSQAQRNLHLMTFLRVKRHYQDGERLVLNEPKVQAQQKQLQEDMVAAMKRHDPKTQQLLDEMDKTERQLHELAGR